MIIINYFFYYLVFHQLISIISSLGSMGWAMSSYHRIIRLAQGDKENINCAGQAIQFFWHFFITGMYLFS